MATAGEKSNRIKSEFSSIFVLSLRKEWKKYLPVFMNVTAMLLYFQRQVTHRLAVSYVIESLPVSMFYDFDVSYVVNINYLFI